MYLEFISAVTEDILSRGHISDRVLDRVIKRHIDMNRHHLHEGKMRHLLEVLRKDFEETPNTFTCGTEFEKKENGLLDTFLPNLEAGEKQVKTQENNDLSLYASLIKDCYSLDYADPLLVSTPLCSPERFDSPTKTTEKYREDDNLEKGISSPGLSEHVSNNTGISEEDFDQIGTAATNKVNNENHENASLSSDKGFHQEVEQAEGSYDGQSKELEDLGRSLSKSLHVSSNTHYTEQHTAASVSDDEF
ncbi:Spermatogenesis-associated protein 7-like protein [Nibea albiflora]|uniref:Spermatogenesis-associated protein 7-like protein n=1 Tax=Nibea albiflora TaxID=240163 RepID=A0ACB7FG79_NIBAL|nr:Spermatogenesis-associated protein 7-like protein [Nibea albiflora]